MEVIEAFYSGLIAVLPLSGAGLISFLFLLTGVILGFFVGLLPGLGGSVSIALLLPFTYSLEPTAAFAFLLGLSAVTATTGDVTSVLLGIPGEGTAAAVVVDGYPMTKRGQAGRALGAALSSSLIGAVFGAFALALAIPVIKPLVLSLGSPEIFMLIMLALTFVAALSGDDLTRGLLVGCFGLALSTVGLDSISGAPRFTFESLIGSEAALYLWDGISLVSVTLGLFAVPEIIALASKQEPRHRVEAALMSSVKDGVKDTFRHWSLVLRCSAIGAYIGLLPGLGGSSAQWIAYGHAVQSSRNPDRTRFGQGAVEGVIGPGAANNAKEGGSLIPTIAFGVPGSVSTAILLAAFTLQGLVPGPDMLNPDKHLSLTFSFVWIIVIANIIAVALCFLFLKQLTDIAYLRGDVLTPFLVILVYLGSFGIKSSAADVIVTLLFGLLGCFMVRFGWQRPPLLLGLVLGAIAENSFFISLQAYGYSWLARPGVVLIALLISVTIIHTLRKAARARKSAPASVRAQRQAPVFGQSILLPAILVISFVYMAYEVLYGLGRNDLQAAYFPGLIAGFGLLLSVLLLLRGRYRSATGLMLFPIWPAAAGLLAYLIAVELLGFYISSFAAVLFYLGSIAKESWPVSAAWALATAGFCYVLFSYWLSIPLPAGLLLAG